MYSETVKKLVAEMPNAGALPGATHRAEGENPVCGDTVRIELRVVDSIVRECRFRASGCPAAIASAAALCALCKGKPLTECLAMDHLRIVDHLEGLPSHKSHGPELAIEVLRKALGVRS